MEYQFIFIILILVVVLALLWTKTKYLNPVKRVVGVKVTPLPSTNDVESIVSRALVLVSQGTSKPDALSTAESEHKEKLLLLDYDSTEADEEAAEARRQAEQYERDEEERLRLDARRKAEQERMGFNDPTPEKVV